MSELELKKWEAAAMEVPSAKVATSFSKPIHVVLREGKAVGVFCKRNWKAVQQPDGTVEQPGLELAIHSTKALLHAGTADEIFSLVSAAGHAQTLFEVHMEEGGTLIARGHACLREMRGLYKWVLDDSADEGLVQMLENLSSGHRSRPPSRAALAMALEAYPLLGERMLAELQEVPTFDATVFQRARTLAKRLRASGSAPTVISEAARAALDLRNRLLRLLRERVEVVRGAARFVFPTDPERLSKVTSAYERKKRATSRRRRAEGTAKQATAAERTGAKEK